MISIRSNSRIFPCLLESYVSMSVMEELPSSMVEFRILEGTAKLIKKLLLKPDYIFLRDKIEFKERLTSLNA